MLVFEESPPRELEPRSIAFQRAGCTSRCTCRDSCARSRPTARASRSRTSRFGSTRRECTDHLIPIDETHLRKILGEYVRYYNTARCHLSLDGNAPEPRLIEDSVGSVDAIPHVGGLHHEYRRAA